MIPDTLQFPAPRGKSWSFFCAWKGLSLNCSGVDPAPLTSRAEPWDQRRPQEGCTWELVCDKPDLLSTAITRVLWSLRASLVNSKHYGCPGFIEKLASVF